MAKKQIPEEFYTILPWHSSRLTPAKDGTVMVLETDEHQAGLGSYPVVSTLPVVTQRALSKVAQQHFGPGTVLIILKAVATVEVPETIAGIVKEFKNGQLVPKAASGADKPSPSNFFDDEFSQSTASTSNNA